MRARIVLERGMLTRENLRFITLTGIGENFIGLFRKFKFFLKKKMENFAYFGVRTGEGRGTVHFVYEGKGVRYSDLSKFWKDISGYWIVHISRIQNYPGIIQEMTRQNKKKRYFYSRNWLPKQSFQTPLFD
jgi:hypothetical protein